MNPNLANQKMVRMLLPAKTSLKEMENFDFWGLNCPSR
jgi:hypothetical protein